MRPTAHAQSQHLVLSTRSAMSTILPFTPHAMGAIAPILGSVLLLLDALSAIKATATNVTLKEGQSTVCATLPRMVLNWYYGSHPNTPYYHGPYTCTYSHDNGERPWGMLNAYRSGGTFDIHWTYAYGNYSNCLEDWDYYDKDGVTLTQRVKGRSIKTKGERAWCAMPVYRPGGVLGKQWDYCNCYYTATK